MRQHVFCRPPFAIGFPAVEELHRLVPAAVSMAAFTLRWILMNEAVTVVIAGVRNHEQARANTAAGDLAPLSANVMAATRDICERPIAPHGHHRWEDRPEWKWKGRDKSRPFHRALTGMPDQLRALRFTGKNRVSPEEPSTPSLSVTA